MTYLASCYDVATGDLIHAESFRTRAVAVAVCWLLPRMDTGAVLLTPVEYRVERWVD